MKMSLMQRRLRNAEIQISIAVTDKNSKQRDPMYLNMLMDRKVII